MRVKTMMKALFLSYLLTCICLLLLAFLLFRFDLGTTPVSAGIVITYVLSCFLGGFAAGRSVQKKRYLWGLLTGICYFLLLLVISYAAADGFRLSIRHISTTFLVCLGAGALGGMFS